MVDGCTGSQLHFIILKLRNVGAPQPFPYQCFVGDCASFPDFHGICAAAPPLSHVPVCPLSVRFPYGNDNRNLSYDGRMCGNRTAFDEAVSYDEVTGNL